MQVNKQGNKQGNELMPAVDMVSKDFFIDILLIILITGLVFGLAYHPYFFGDELVAQNLAIHNNYSFSAIYQEVNSYKPRLIFNGIDALLAKYQASRSLHAFLVVACMVWINILLYSIVRNLLKGSRALCWLLVATVLTSRYGVMFYFDYLSGLIELLSTALLISVFYMAWLAWHEEFKGWYATGALLTAILTVFVHERYAVGLLAFGCALGIAEFVGSLAKKRFIVLVWALSLGVVPLLLFWVATKTLADLPITTGTSGHSVTLSRDTLLCMLTYIYNVFLGGNYGHEWFWGHYNHLQPVGKLIGWATALCTIVMTVMIVLLKKLVWGNRWLGLSLIGVALAFIVIASLVGSGRQEARFMFPVGILVTMIWIIMTKGAWRYFTISIILVVNIIFLLLDSNDSISNVYSSRAARSISESLLSVKPNGQRGIVVGNNDNKWSINGGASNGDAFSKVNLKNVLHIESLVMGRLIDPALYDFGLAFIGFGPHRTARYRIVSVETALILAGVSDVDKLPIHSVIGNKDIWSEWLWNIKPDNSNGAVVLRSGIEGWKSMPSSDLDGRWLVYQARVRNDEKVPMRLQVNWHAKQNNQFLSTSIQVVYPNEVWHSYSTLLTAPQGADIGYVYATLHDGAQGEVELRSVELK